MLDIETGQPGGQDSQPFDPDMESVEYSWVQQALESPKGLKLTFESPNEAVNMRQRIYKLRQRLAKKGITSLGMLTISISGKELTMYKVNVKVEEL